MQIVNHDLIVLLFDLCWNIFGTVASVNVDENFAFAFEDDIDVVVHLILNYDLVAFGVLFYYVECLGVLQDLLAS